MYSFPKIKAALATLTVGLLLAIALAATAQATNTTPQGMSRLEWKALNARAEAWNRYYHLGAYSPAAIAKTAEKGRAKATDRYYHL